MRTAASGSEALRHLAQATPDLILCDLMMPGMGGDDVYRSMTDAQRDRTLIITGGAVSPAAEAFLTEVEDKLVHKPLSRGALRKSAEAARRRHLERSAR